MIKYYKYNWRCGSICISLNFNFKRFVEFFDMMSLDNSTASVPLRNDSATTNLVTTTTVHSNGTLVRYYDHGGLQGTTSSRPKIDDGGLTYRMIDNGGLGGHNSEYIIIPSSENLIS